MSISKLVRSTIINGASSLAVAVKEGIVYRLQPVEEMTPIVFTNFTNNYHKVINLSEIIDQDYRVVAMTVDIARDDRENEMSFNTEQINPSTTINIRIVKQDKAVEEVFAIYNKSPIVIDGLYLEHTDIWKIKTDQTVRAVTLRCVPVIINQPKVFSDNYGQKQYYSGVES